MVYSAVHPRKQLDIPPEAGPPYIFLMLCRFTFINEVHPLKQFSNPFGAISVKPDISTEMSEVHPSKQFSSAPEYSVAILVVPVLDNFGIDTLVSPLQL